MTSTSSAIPAPEKNWTGMESVITTIIVSLSAAPETCSPFKQCSRPLSTVFENIADISFIIFDFSDPIGDIAALVTGSDRSIAPHDDDPLL
jgi:hypothetical protein